MQDDIQRLATKFEDHNKRLTVLEAKLTMTEAVRAERDKHMDKRFDQLEAGVNEVKGYLLRIVWVIVLGIIGALMTFILNGGLNAIPKF